MDKRWIYFIIILVIGFSGLYYIVGTSTTVGSAIVGINSFTLTVPDSFNIENNDHGFASLINRQTKLVQIQLPQITIQFISIL